MRWLLLDTDTALERFEAGCLRRFAAQERDRIQSDMERVAPPGWRRAGRPPCPADGRTAWQRSRGWHYEERPRGCVVYPHDEGGALVGAVTAGDHAHIPAWRGDGLGAPDDATLMAIRALPSQARAAAVHAALTTQAVELGRLQTDAEIDARPARDKHRVKLNEIRGGTANPRALRGGVAAGQGRRR